VALPVEFASTEETCNVWFKLAADEVIDAAMVADEETLDENKVALKELELAERKVVPGFETAVPILS